MFGMGNQIFTVERLRMIYLRVDEKHNFSPLVGELRLNAPSHCCHIFGVGCLDNMLAHAGALPTYPSSELNAQYFIFLLTWLMNFSYVLWCSNFKLIKTPSNDATTFYRGYCL